MYRTITVQFPVAPLPPALLAAEPALMTVQQAADFLGCTARTLKQRLSDRDLPGVKIGKAWMVPRAALIERLNQLARQHVVVVQTPAAAPVVVSPYDPTRYAPYEKRRGRPRLPLPPID